MVISLYRIGNDIAFQQNLDGLFLLLQIDIGANLAFNVVNIFLWIDCDLSIKIYHRGQLILIQREVDFRRHGLTKHQLPGLDIQWCNTDFLSCLLIIEHDACINNLHPLDSQHEIRHGFCAFFLCLRFLFFRLAQIAPVIHSSLVARQVDLKPLERDRIDLNLLL